MVVKRVCGCKREYYEKDFMGNHIPPLCPTCKKKPPKEDAK